MTSPDRAAIGPATVDDAAAMLAVQRRAFAEEGRRVGPLDGGAEIPPLAEPLQALVAHIRSQTALVARRDGAVVGAVRGVVSERRCVVRALVVDPACQGQGWGSQLLQALERSLPHVERFDLTTNLMMPGNVAFYERHGYHLDEVTQHEGRIPLAQMSKSRDAGPP